LLNREGTDLPDDDDSPFLNFVGVEIGLSEGGEGRVSLSVQPHHLQGAGQVHGGLIAVLADTAMFRAVRSLLGPGQRTTTIELKVNFLENTNSGRLTATAKVVSSDGRLMVGDIEVKDGDGRLIAQGLGTFLVIGGS
jgi:uncharacterized protein (TIGR00369 family)